MTHLGDRLISLIDGELDHDARDRVLAHLAVCRQCRDEADAQRRLKDLMSGLDGPEPPTQLVRRLRSLAEPGEPIPPEPPDWPNGSAGSGRAAGFDGHGSPRPHAPSRLFGRRGSFAVAGMFCLATAAATTAFAVGERNSGGVRVVPHVDRYAVEHSVMVSRVPLADPAVTGSVSQPRP